jgi:glycosyltransferase involved in cell wall biosynthesis
MLSVLIPIFNFDCRNFIRSIHDQATDCNIPFEIRCYDDGSEHHFRELNKQVAQLPHVVYREMADNMGRSGIRNLLATDSAYDNLLFMDCDSQIDHSDFIAKYVASANKHSVIYGGRSYESDAPADSAMFLRWLYGTVREVSSATERARHPYRSFMTNNFMIPKDIFMGILFNTELKGYGHEDTLFGYGLEKRKIKIEHIENPLCHIGLENTSEFLEKTAEGIKNLAYIYKKQWPIGNVKLLSTYKRLRFFGLHIVMLMAFKIKRNTLQKNLLSDNPSLRDFDLYKLGLLCEAV